VGRHLLFLSLLLLIVVGASGCRAKKKLPNEFAPVRKVATTGKMNDPSESWIEIQHPRPPGSAAWMEKYKQELENEHWTLVADKTTATYCDYNGEHDREASCVETVYRQGGDETSFNFAGAKFIHVKIYEPHGPDYRSVVIVNLDTTDPSGSWTAEGWKRAPRPSK
jgi:hypothetical protein